MATLVLKAKNMKIKKAAQGCFNCFCSKR